MELLVRPRRRPSALWGGIRRSRRECRHLARHGSGLRGLRRVARRLGAWPAPRSCHDLRPLHAEHDQAAGKAFGDRSPRSRPIWRCWWRSKPTWRHRPGRARATARSGRRLRVCRDIRVARKRVLRLMRENNLNSRPHRCRRRGGNPHDGEIITHAPNLMWGTDGVRVFTVDDGNGAGSSPPSSIGTPSVSAGMSASAATASPPCNRSPWGLPGCMARPRPMRGSGAGPCGWIYVSQYLTDHFTNQIKFWGIQAEFLRLRRRAPDQRRRRAVQSHAEGTDHPWSLLPQHRGAAGRRPRLRRTLQCPVESSGRWSAT